MLVVQILVTCDSIISQHTLLTNIAALPFVKQSPTGWTNLCSALKVCQNISITACNRATMVSTDFQLRKLCN